MAKTATKKKAKGPRPAWSVRLQALRIANGFGSHAEIASKIGATGPQYGHWERGDREPHYEALVRIKQVLGCSLDFLLANDLSKAPAGHVSQQVTTSRDAPHNDGRRRSAGNDW